MIIMLDAGFGARGARTSWGVCLEPRVRRATATLPAGGEVQEDSRSQGPVPV